MSARRADRQPLTQAMVDRAQPGAAEYHLWNAEVPGLAVRVQPSGARAYVLRLGRVCTTLGPVASLRLRAARAEARVLLRRAERSAAAPASGAMPFASLAESYRARKTETLSVSGAKAMGCYLRRLNEAFAATLVDALTVPAVADWFHAYSRRAPGGANEALIHLRAILAHGRDTGVLGPGLPGPDLSSEVQPPIPARTAADRCRASPEISQSS